MPSYSYWILEYYSDVGWVAFGSTLAECRNIISDSENEATFACKTDYDLSDYEIMFRLDIANPEDLCSFEMNELYFNNKSNKIHVRDSQDPEEESQSESPYLLRNNVK
jgi:hypothetical protein